MAIRITQVMPVSETLPNTVTQQAYLIGSGLAQGAANLVLAKGLAKYPEVPTEKLAAATVLSAVLTFVPVFFFLELLKKDFEK